MEHRDHDKAGADGPLPIEAYGAIGDMRSLALVGTDGSIDWLCLPRFDSPSVFAALLDAERGGRFRVGPASAEVTQKQRYLPDTNVLITRFMTAEGSAELIDFMPVGEHRRSTGSEVIRRLTTVRGQVSFELLCQPAMDYGRAGHRLSIEGQGAVFAGDSLRLGLYTDVPLTRAGDAVSARFTLREDETATFCLRGLDDQEEPADVSFDAIEQLFRRTVNYWHTWLSSCTYAGRWREMVQRSALALKLLTYEPSGAIVAAPSTSLPEQLGGARNWDYRYTWIRDSAFTINALLKLGFTREARDFIDFLQSVIEVQDAQAVDGEDGPLQLMYGIDGRTDLPEQTLDHLRGYRGSAPVRIGNEAYRQLQLDIHGELIWSIYLYDQLGAPITHQTWASVRRCADWIGQNWQRKDNGIWESRGDAQHFVYSRLMCWVALDKAIRLAIHRALPGRISAWTEARDAIFAEVLSRGWDPDLQAFVRCYGRPSLDAANLMMSIVGFFSPVDPNVLSNLEATMRPLRAGGLMANHLLYRYAPEGTSDGLGGEEGTFNVCTFWLVEALTLAGRHRPEYLPQARLIFERMLGVASPVGLYGEQTGPRGETLGNYPQALTHLALISAATELDAALQDSTVAVANRALLGDQGIHGTSRKRQR